MSEAVASRAQKESRTEGGMGGRVVSMEEGRSASAREGERASSSPEPRVGPGEQQLPGFVSSGSRTQA